MIPTIPMPRTTSRWRLRARAAIHAALRGAADLSFRDRLAAVDAAYPFGERALAPYKAWLVERRIVVDALAPAPTRDEADVCRVARDAVELGQTSLLPELFAQAPNRLARKCPTCGRRIGRACSDLETGADMLVPHEARVGDVPRSGDSGPLFSHSEAT